MPATNGIKVPLNGLISKLKTEGFEISTRTVLDIQKVLTGFNNVANPDTANLKLILGPLICRNKEEQEKFYKLFDDYEEALKSQAGQLMEEYSVKKNEDEQRIKAEHEKKKIENEKRKRKRKIVKWGIISLSGLLLAALSYYFIVIRCLFCSAPPPELRTASLTILYNGQAKNFAENDETEMEIVKDSLVEISSTLSDTISEKKYKVIIVIGDSSYNQRSVSKHIIQAGELKVDASLMEGDSVIYNISETNQVLCEPKPELIIEKDSSFFRKGKSVIYRVKNYQDGNYNKYTYKWTLTGKPDTLPTYTGTGASFKIRPPALAAYSILVEATGSVNKQCEKKSYTKSIEERPQLVLQVTGLKKLEPGKDFNFMFVVILLVGSGIFIGRLNSWYYEKRITALREKYFPVYETEVDVPKTTDELTRPYSIEFKPQENKIPAEISINQLAEVMRKRHTGDSYSLNINRTIWSTIKKAGFPVFEFTALSQPTDFLVFVDKEYADSHLVKLYNHLIATLRKEQVHITAYSYNQYPLLLTNPALNHFFIPVEKLGGLYPGTILFLFAETSSFFRPYDSRLHDWVIEKFKDWKTKIIFTSVAVKDWGEKETILYEAGFTVIPADTNASQVIEEEINNLIDKQKLKKTIPSTYSTKLINFNEWEEVKNYLRDVSKENKKTTDTESLYLLLKEWLASTTVYPYVNWEATIAIGKAFEEKYNVPGKLLNYTNLLALSRIQWLKDGQIPDNLRIEMLKDLDYKNEITAREAVKGLLDELKDDIKPGSAIYEEYRLLTVTNDFLIKKFNKGDIAPDDKDFIAMDNYIQEGELDWHLDVFYNSKDADSSIRDKSGEKSIPIKEFLVQRKEEQKIIDENNNKEFQAKKRSLNTRFGLMSMVAILLVLAIQLFGFKQMPFEPPRTVDRIINFGSMINSSDQIAVIVDGKLYDTEFSGDSAFIVKSLPNDTSLLAKVSLARLGVQDATISLGYSEYTMGLVNPGDLTAVYISYTDENEFKQIEPALINALNQYAINAGKADSLNIDTTRRVVFYRDAQQQDAQNIATITSSVLGRKVETRKVAGDDDDIGMFLYFEIDETCIPANLPSELNEIWKGGTSKRLININFNKRVIYYSTGDKNTYGTYPINNICLNDGVYRIITGTGNQFKVFFIKDVSGSSFSLSVCQDFYNTLDEAEKIANENCDRYNLMNLYYETNPSRVYLPVGSARLTATEAAKVKSKGDSFSVNNNSKVSTTVHENEKYISKIKKSTLLSYLPNHGLNYDLRTDILYPMTGQGPFDRHYIVINFSTITNPCEKTYSSLTEAAKMNRNEICRLNLSRQKLETLPVQLDRFNYLNWLDIRYNYLTDQDSIRLYKLFPKAVILFYPQLKIIPESSPPARLDTIEAQSLADGDWKLNKKISLDEKYIPLENYKKYLDLLANEFKTNDKARVLIQVYFYENKLRYVAEQTLRSLNNYLSSTELKAYSARIQYQPVKLNAAAPNLGYADFFGKDLSKRFIRLAKKEP